MTLTGHVSLWHPWQDKPGLRHKLTLWHREKFPTCIDELVTHVAGLQQYVFCTDILDPLIIPLELLRHGKSQAYMSRTGKVVALRVRRKKSGFFIPGVTWGYKKLPDERLLEAIAYIFKRFELEAITPSSLSEKVLRSTLPEKLFISRPSHMLRSLLLDKHKGGRIDRATRRKHRKAYSYDEIKAYLFHSRKCPSPFVTARYLVFAGSSECSYRYNGYATSFLHVALTAHGSGIQPIQVMDQDTQVMRQPREGESLDEWLWTEELDDCIRKGYTLDAVFEGYCFPEYSDFLSPWSDILWNFYQEEEDNVVKDILKQMMVGLPGRFLKSPESYTLIHASEHCRSDIPIMAAYWRENDMVARPWFLRPEFDMQSAQLTPIGSYIVMKCRQELYHKMQAEEDLGNQIISSYIDCYTTTQESKLPQGTYLGEWKLKDSYTNVWAEDNRLIPEDIERMRSPGFTGRERLALYHMYQQAKEEIEV